MNINEEQNRAKLIKLRKRHLIVKQRFYKSFGIQYRLHLHFYLLWKDRIACALKTWRSWINVRDASFFLFFPCHRALSNNATLSQIRTHHRIRRGSRILKRGVNFCNNVIEPKPVWGARGLCINMIDFRWIINIFEF